MKIRTKLIVANLVVIGVPLSLCVLFVAIATESMPIGYFKGILNQIFMDAEFLWGRVIPYIAGAVAIVLGLCAFLMIFMSQWVARSILKPLRRLSVAAEMIRDGNLNFELTSKRNDEIGQLTKDFNEMRKYLKESVDERIRYDQYRHDLIRDMSHDLRTPLTSIKGYVEGLRDGVASNPKTKERYYRAIGEGVNRMEGLIDELSGFARLESNEYHYKKEATELNEFYEQTVAKLQDEFFMDNVKVNLQSSDKPIIADIDRREFARISRNVVENSVKYRDKEHTEVVFRISCDERNAYIDIDDNGPGVNDYKIGNIFNAFYRCDDSRNSVIEGSGIGLAVVSKIMQAHGGSARARNLMKDNKIKGLRIRLRLPLDMNAKLLLDNRLGSESHD